jgi:ribose 5-phosphate isomerase B
MRIAIAADHNGVGVKRRLAEWLTGRGHEVDDRGTHDPDEVVDYPALCADVARLVVSGRAERGIVVGGTGGGEAIACNKIRGIRAGLCHTPFLAEISSGHNATNVLVLGAKVVSADEAVTIADVWLRTPFKGGRHQERVDQIMALERDGTG